MLREALTTLLVAAPFGLGVATGEAETPRPLFRFEDPDIVESSGLAVVDDRVVTTNDSGDEGRVFVVDPDSGRTVGVTRWQPEPEDVEALAPGGSKTVWVGDIGDNPGSRDSISVLEVPVGARAYDADVEPVRLRYPDGPHDAEALLVHPRTGRLHVVTKEFFGGEVFEAPASLDPGRTHRLRPVGTVMAVVTDGAFLPDGRHLVLRNYTRAVVYTWPGLEAVGEIDLPPQQQGEGIAVTGDGSLLVSSEGQLAPVYEIAVPRAIEDAMSAGPADDEASEGPTSISREGEELPEDDPGRRDPTQWLIGTGLLVVALVGLWLSIRPSRPDPPR